MRTFIIGDIHGCFDEFIELTQKIGLQDNDLILTREDFTTSKEVYEAHRDKLLEIMKEVKSRVPEYTER